MRQKVVTDTEKSDCLGPGLQNACRSRGSYRGQVLATRGQQGTH